ncbi:Satratoxin biosynthesis SC1 cluster protein 4 [Colletotrichum spinosum]|uniref:Satratoxin biosynthesis SC1 cluster protein 4 n=1 Tax=Colletotrichum spinosum TaxID=1347390 RepID=A0A4V3HS04_9PEZI|nr:Satratoxin biosynthesis SC1 cluster protein 4 [Colletotrichum spinosum]
MWDIGGVRVVPRNYGLVFSSFFFTIFASLVVGIRTYTRAILVKNLGADDALMVVALIGTIGYLVTMIQQIKWGLGDTIGLEELQEFLRALYATVVCYNFTQLCVKFSILLQYRRIFRTEKAAKIILGLMVWLALYSAFCLGTSIFTCWPVAKYWDNAIEGGCIERSALNYAIAGFNILNDLIILLLPVPWLRGLQVTFRAKLVLIGVFTCGAFAAIVAIVRLHSLFVHGSAPIDQQPLVGVDIAVWSGLEINIAIICASVPALKALFVKIIPKLGTYKKYSKNPYGRNTSGNMPLQSFDKRTGNFSTKAKGPIEIKVQTSIQMNSVPAEDDDSEKHLVFNG